MARLPPGVPKRETQIATRLTPAMNAWLIGRGRATNTTRSDVLRSLVQAEMDWEARQESARERATVRRPGRGAAAAP